MLLVPKLGKLGQNQILKVWGTEKIGAVALLVWEKSSFEWYLLMRLYGCDLHHIHIKKWIKKSWSLTWKQKCIQFELTFAPLTRQRPVSVLGHAPIGNRSDSITPIITYTAHSMAQKLKKPFVITNRHCSPWRTLWQRQVPIKETIAIHGKQQL